MYRQNNTKIKLANRENVLGIFSNLGHSTVVELLGLSGLDFIIIDQEHGQGDIVTLTAQLQAISSTPANSIVRVPWNDHVYIKRVLDAGVEGIMVPGIETGDEARAAVAACRYPPLGRRGSGYGGRVSSFGLAKDYLATYSDNLIIALQIESVKAVENIDDILAVEGFDVAFIGPYDLSATAGQMNDLNHPDVAKRLRYAEERILASGKAMGTVRHGQTPAVDMFKLGYGMVTVRNETVRIWETVVAEVAAFRAHAASPKASE